MTFLKGTKRKIKKRQKHEIGICTERHKSTFLLALKCLILKQILKHVVNACNVQHRKFGNNFLTYFMLFKPYIFQLFLSSSSISTPYFIFFTEIFFQLCYYLRYLKFCARLKLNFYLEVIFCTTYNKNTNFPKAV